MGQRQGVRYDGAATIDKFPQLSVLGAAYVLPDSIALISADIVFSNAGTTTLQAGAEVPLTPTLHSVPVWTGSI